MSFLNIKSVPSMDLPLVYQWNPPRISMTAPRAHSPVEESTHSSCMMSSALTHTPQHHRRSKQGRKHHKTSHVEACNHHSRRVAWQRHVTLVRRSDDVSAHAAVPRPAAERRRCSSQNIIFMFHIFRFSFSFFSFVCFLLYLQNVYYVCTINIFFL